MEAGAEEELRKLLIAVAESPPDQRYESVDRAAAHGPAAIDAVADWLYDGDRADFALAVISRVAAAGAAQKAYAVLADVQRRQIHPIRLARLVREAERIGEMLATQATRQRASLTHLERGATYRRSELHAAGLGGNRQTGISYPRTGDHALLMSTAGGKGHFGYHDRWEGDDYIYYGEWKGGPEMSMSGGNAAIIERSPNLYLFTSLGHGEYRFEGRMEYVEHSTEWTERAGKRQQAIVFRLRRVADRVDVH
jgi:hypothetical protein